MLSCSSTFKEKMKVYGKQINVLLEFDNQALSKNKVVSLEQTINGEMFTSVCRLLTLEVEKNKYATQDELLLVKDVNTRTVKSLMQTKMKYLTNIYENAKIEDASEVNVKVGVKIDDEEEYEYVDWGKFVVYELKDCVDTKSYKLTLYDHLLDTHIKYNDDPMELDYASGNITVKVLLQAICTKFGFTLKTNTFANYNKVIHEDKYANLDVTYRDILDEIAGCAGGFIKIFNKDLYVAYPTETSETIDEHDLKSLDIGNKVGAFNTLVLARSPQEDNIYYPASMENSEERIAVRIENNQIMDKNREDFIVALYNKIKGLEYYVFECEHYGFAYYEFGDIVTIKDLNGNLYKTILMDVIDTINTGITGKLYSDETEFAETKYEYASSLEKRIKNTEIICDKQNGQIKLLIEEKASYEEKVSKIEMDIDSITETVTNNTNSIKNIKSDAVSEAIKAAQKEIGTELDDYKIEVGTIIETKAGEIETNLTGKISTQMSGYVKTAEMTQHVSETINSYDRTITEKYITKTASKEVTDSLSSRIGMTAKSIKLGINNGSTTSGITIEWTKENGETDYVQGTITMSGMVKFTDLSGSGTTTINGANIKTGTISSEHLDTSTIKATSGTIGGININSEGLMYSGSSAYDGFRLIKGGQVYDTTPAGVGSYIIMTAGGNQAHTGSAKFRVYQNGCVYAEQLYTADNYIFTKTKTVQSIEIGASGATAWVQVTPFGTDSYGLTFNRSDERLKKNIKKSKVDALDVVNRMEIIEFDWKDNDVHEKVAYRAQQLQTLDEQLVVAIPQPERSRTKRDFAS